MSQEESKEQTLEEAIQGGLEYYGNKYRTEIEHLKKVNPEARVGAFIFREYTGALLAIYDLDRSETEPVYVAGILPDDWKIAVTALPGSGLAVPMLTPEVLTTRLIEGLTKEYDERAKATAGEPVAEGAE